MNVSNITPYGIGGPAASRGPVAAPTDAGGFARALNGLLGGASAQNAKANEAVSLLAQGKTDNLHSIALEAARADLSFRLVLEIRNRLIEAYQEVMRMQV